MITRVWYFFAHKALDHKRRRPQHGFAVHHFSEDVWSLNVPSFAAELFLPIENVVPPKLMFLYRVLAQPLSVITDDTTSFQPLGMLPAWKEPQPLDCVQVKVAPLKLMSL